MRQVVMYANITQSNTNEARAPCRPVIALSAKARLILGMKTSQLRGTMGEASSTIMPSVTHETPLILPSLLASDWSKVGAEVQRAEAVGVQWLHLDVMDGAFVDNISFGPAMVQTVHETNDIYLDVHLMISRPDHFLPRFIAAGPDGVSTGRQDAAFRRLLAKGYAFYRSIGTRRMTAKRVETTRYRQ